ncbi:MAG: hypothetical protein ORN29_00955 [Rhodoferax sp.]|nr:hypothetical protein [Rhodoferax sp.]
MDCKDAMPLYRYPQNPSPGPAVRDGLHLTLKLADVEQFLLWQLEAHAVFKAFL